MEKNEYHLIIDINSEISATGETPSSPTGAISSTNSAEQRVANTMKRLVKYEIARPFLNTTKQMIQNNVDTYYGSGELSQRINFGLSMGTTAYQTAMQGMALSSVLGLTTGVGVLITSALTLMQKGLEIVARQNEINNKQRLENEQLQILRGRAGVQFNRSRMGE